MRHPLGGTPPEQVAWYVTSNQIIAKEAISGRVHTTGVAP
jgi:hypothetical protein